MTSINKYKKKGAAKVENTAKSITTKKVENKTKKSAESTTKNPAKSSKPKKMKLPIMRRLHIRTLYPIAGAVVTLLAFFFIRVALWEHSYLAAKEGSERDVVSSTIEVNEGNGTTEEIDSTEPTVQEVQEYIVAPDKPRYLNIPYLGIHARIVEIGLKNQSEMATPYNIFDVGWYTGSGSVLPGQDGVSIMNAHGGNLGYGIFRNLPKLPIGETIRIEMGDGRVFTYKVVESVIKNLGDEANQYMSTAFTPVAGASSTLCLITCTGDGWDSSQTYSQRLLVRGARQ